MANSGTFTLNVNIDPLDLTYLKDDKHVLCIARKVNGQYTVVWSGSFEYLSANEFQWLDEYQVYGVNKFKDGALVKAATNEEDIEFGQTCILDTRGVMGSATGSVDTSGEFKVVNNYGRISLGVNSKLNDKFAPMFVSPTTITGTATFEPIATVQVWFSQQMKTGTMIFQADSTPIEVKYSGKVTTRTVQFANGKWVRQ